MICPQCHKIIDDQNARFCPGCGFHLAEIQTKTYCPQCSKEITDKNTKFCPECGFCIGCVQETTKCPRCHKELPDKNAKFCIECGYHIHGYGEFNDGGSFKRSDNIGGPNVVSQTSNNDSKKVLRAIGIALLIIGIGMAIVAIIIPNSMDGWEYRYSGGKETTIAVAVTGGAMLVLGFCMLIATKTTKADSAYTGERVVQEETFHGVCEVCGAESDNLVCRKVDEYGGWKKVCDVCAYNAGLHTFGAMASFRDKY